MQNEDAAEPAPFTLDDDCLRNIVEWTSSANTLFSLARVSPTLKQIVHERLIELHIPAPALSIYSHRARLQAPLRYVGAYVGNQYLVFGGTTHVFTHKYDTVVWRRFLASLPVLKRIYILCCCKSLLVHGATRAPR